MTKRTVDDAAVRRAVVRSVRSSAKLERREVPKGYVRSAKVEAFVAKRTHR